MREGGCDGWGVDSLGGVEGGVREGDGGLKGGESSRCVS